MTIHETPVIEHLSVDVWDPTAGAWREMLTATSVDITRGAKDRVEVGTASIALVGDVDLAYDRAFRPNSPVRVRGLAEGQRLFTGIIANASQAQRRVGGRLETFTTILATDAVQAIANTVRHGAVSANGLGYETFRSRILRLCESSPVPTLPPPASGTPLPVSLAAASPIVPAGYSTGYGTNTRTGIVELRAFRNTGASAIAVGALGIQVRLSGLVVGRVYTARASIRAGRAAGTVTGLARARARVDTILSDAFDVNAASPSPSPLLEFTATDTAHILRFENAATGAVGTGASALFEMRALEVAEVEGASDYQLQDVEYEASLASHFDVACATVGGAWFVDSDGIVQFRRGRRDEALAATFTDEHLVDAAVGFDTRNAVNVLELENLGRAPSTSKPGEWDSTSTTYEAAHQPSIRRWGSRADRLTVSLYTGVGYTSDLQRRAVDEFTRRARPAFGVSRAKWNAQQRPALAAALEIQDRVSVARGDVRQTCRIAQLSHRITPTRWMVDMTFTDVRVGPTFAELDDALIAATPAAGPTFAQLNAAHAGKTFTQFNQSINQETP